MLGLMQDRPSPVSSLIERAARFHGSVPRKSKLRETFRDHAPPGA